MSDRKNSRLNLPGLIAVTLMAASAVYFLRPSESVASQALDKAQTASTLQSLAELDGKAPTNRKLDVQTWTTTEGAKVLFVEAHELPMFDMRLLFAAGSSQDGDVPGLALMTNAMLNEGVPGKDVSQIASGFEGLGADFGNGAYRDMALVTLRSLSDSAKRDAALSLFNQVIGQPTFPADSLARIKNQILAGFEYQKQNPGKLASIELFKRLYGDHPYAHPSEGTPKSVPKITLAQLQAFHAKAYAAGNAVIAVVGDLTRGQGLRLAAQGAGDGQDRPADRAKSRPEPYRVPVQANPPAVCAVGHRPCRPGLRSLVPG